VKSNTTDKFYIPFVVVNTGPYVLDFLFQLVNVLNPSIKSKGCMYRKFSFVPAVANVDQVVVFLVWKILA
jgi:hypothetical protein